MIKLECDKEGLSKLEVSGTTPEIAAEFLSVIREIYCRMRDVNEENPALFKEFIESGIDILFLPDEEIDKKLNEQEIGKNDAHKMLEKLNEAVEELKKALYESESEGEA